MRKIILSCLPLIPFLAAAWLPFNLQAGVETGGGGRNKQSSHLGSTLKGSGLGH